MSQITKNILMIKPSSFGYNVDTAEEAAKLLQANVFATDPDYAKKIMQLIRDAKRNPPLF